MNFNLQAPLTAVELRKSTLLFSVLACILGLPLLWLGHDTLPAHTPAAVLIAAGMFWGSLTLIAFRYFWEMYYCYFYPDSLRRFGALNSLLYACIAWLMWLAIRYAGDRAAIIFLCLGGVEGLLEHIVGIYLLRILDNVPWLRELKVIPILLFSFVEYIVYWAVVLWLTLGIQMLILAIAGA